MTTGRSATGPLQLIFSFFLGLMVVAFVGIGVNTSLPGPKEPEFPIGFEGKEPPPEFHEAMRHYQQAFQHWALTTSIILLVCATLIMVISLVRSERLPVVSNGVLLGGVFNMVYSVGMTLASSQSWLRFVVVSVALCTTVGVGYFKFARHKATPVAAPAEPPVDAASGAELVARVTAIESRLATIAEAWRSDRS